MHTLDRPRRSSHPGQVNGIALTFRAELYEGISHTLDPWTWPASSWATSVWVLSDPIEVNADSVLRVVLSPSGPRSSRQCSLGSSWTDINKDRHALLATSS